jgi:hypothetical protein
VHLGDHARLEFVQPPDEQLVVRDVCDARAVAGDGRAGADADGLSSQATAAVPAARITAPATAARIETREPRRAEPAARAGGASSGADSRMRASPMSRSRCCGSRSRQRATSARRDGGVSAGRRRRSISSLSTAASVSVTDRPAPNRRSPVSISYTTTPNAQMSARLSTGRPRACSGAM